MKKFKKILTAAIAAAITLTTGTVAFALSQPESTTSSSLYKITGNYGYFECKKGYAETTNTTENLRLVSASVEVHNDTTGDYIKTFYDNDVVGYNGSIPVKATGYMTGNYNYTCRGSIYGNASHNSPVVDSFKKTIGPNG